MDTTNIIERLNKANDDFNATLADARKKYTVACNEIRRELVGEIATKIKNKWVAVQDPYSKYRHFYINLKEIWDLEATSLDSKIRGRFDYFETSSTSIDYEINLSSVRDLPTARNILYDDASVRVIDKSEMVSIINNYFDDLVLKVKHGIFLDAVVNKSKRSIDCDYLFNRRDPRCADNTTNNTNSRFWSSSRFLEGGKLSAISIRTYPHEGNKLGEMPSWGVERYERIDKGEYVKYLYSSRKKMIKQI